MASDDVDYKIVELILSTGELSKESRNDPTFHQCIYELATLPMCRLANEPSYLRESLKRVVEENYALAFDNYSTFIQTAECTKEIFRDFEKVEQQNKRLSDKISHFIELSNGFVDKGRKTFSCALTNSLTLQKHNQILEVLEIPLLLEACIRNNYIDEALEVISHTRKLERRHPNIKVIANVAQESRQAAQKLFDQLFQQLSGNLQLPACLKIVGYLRRMDCLPDPLLRLKFLQCRDSHLNGLLRSLPTNDPFFHASKYMEVTRVHLFDTATQYRAVFSDDESQIIADSSSYQQSLLFSSWLVMRIRMFLINLATDLDGIVQNSVYYGNVSTKATPIQTSSQSIGSKLQSLLGQSMYFGLSLSRIGADFRGHLINLFYQSVLKFINIRLLEVTDSFADCIPSYKWTANTVDDTTYTVRGAFQLMAELLASQNAEEVVAPFRLMSHPLLAMLVNQLIAVLEEIRLCCPRVLRPKVCRAYADSIQRIADILIRFYQEEAVDFTDRDRAAYTTMLSAFVSVLVPHISHSLTVLFSTDYATLSSSKQSLDIKTISEKFIGVLGEPFFAMPSDDVPLADGYEQECVSEAISDDMNEVTTNQQEASTPLEGSMKSCSLVNEIEKRSDEQILANDVDDLTVGNKLVVPIKDESDTHVSIDDHIDLSTVGNKPVVTIEDENDTHVSIDDHVDLSTVGNKPVVTIEDESDTHVSIDDHVDLV